MEPVSQLPIPLLRWYSENARILPWREDPTPYRVWVSEIMLQQTRVTAVLGYFSRFLAAFPDVYALAAAPEDTLMKLWQGLGYYSRARNLQKAARQIVGDFGGVFPSEVKALRSLAGVGEYTAAAVASIAFGVPVVAVDGNLLRVAARIQGDEGDIMTPAVKKRLTALLQSVLPVKEAGKFNQAMMDLGAMVCLPSGAPLCETCPAAAFCAAHLTGRTAVLPVRGKKPKRRQENRIVFLLFYEGKIALRKRPDKGLLAGLWEYPNTAEGDAPDFPLPETSFCGVGTHIFTHVEWHMTAQRGALSSPVLPDGWVLADRQDWEERYAIPSAFSAFREAVEEGLR